jgi:uncharacterized membrane protein YeaQ/YmgE (transglycosylase-associated protein family)
MTRHRRVATTSFGTQVALRCVAAMTAARRRRNASTVQRFNAATPEPATSKPFFLLRNRQSDTTRLHMDFSAHSIIWTLFIGLVVGAIAKLLMPGKDPGGCIVTILLGIAGAFVGTWIGRIFAGGNYVAGWIMSVVGAMILLLLYRLLFRRS